MSDFETLLLNIDERGVAYLTLNREAVHNAMNAQLIQEMQQAVRHIDMNDAIRVVVLGSVGQTFCAGGDLAWMKSNLNKSREERIAETGQLADMLAALDHLSKPLIARVQGSAFGGGIGMLSVCDIVVAVEGATFGLTEVKLGLAPATISPYVVRRIGVTKARRNFLNARLFKTDEAEKMGLVSCVVAESELDVAVEAEIKLILKCAPGAIAASKKLIDYVAHHNHEQNRLYTANALADAWESAEGAEGIEAFFAKRKANWVKE